MSRLIYNYQRNCSKMVLGCTIAQLLCAGTATLCPFSKTLINTGEAIKAYTSKLNAFYLFPFTSLKVCNVLFITKI